MLLPYLCWGWIAAEPNESKGNVDEPGFFTHRLREQTRPIQMLSRLRALFLAAGVGMFEGRNVGVLAGLPCLGESCRTSNRTGLHISHRGRAATEDGK